MRTEVTFLPITKGTPQNPALPVAVGGPSTIIARLLLWGRHHGGEDFNLTGAATVLLKKETRTPGEEILSAKEGPSPPKEGVTRMGSNRQGSPNVVLPYSFSSD